MIKSMKKRKERNYGNEKNNGNTDETDENEIELDEKEMTKGQSRSKVVKTKKM